MNERMRELELKAIAYADSKVPAQDRYNDIYHSIVRGKFAELILQDVLSLSKKQKFECAFTSYRQGINDTMDAICEQYGVER